MGAYTSDDHPVEDMFGTEVMTGDKWFQDAAGRVVSLENAERYLLEVGGFEIVRAL